MKILVANLGSTSFKYRLFDMNGEKVLARGGVERILQIDAAGTWDALSETYRPAGKPSSKSTSKSRSASAKGRRKPIPA